MTPSPKAFALAQEFEGCRLSAYQDGGGKWTLGYGHTAGVTPSQACTEEQAEAWLQDDLNEAGKDVNWLIDVALTQNEFDALADFVFNLGAGSLERSTLRKYLNSGQVISAAAEFPKWDNVHGIPSEGLRRRRLAEQELFLST
jgi:lysozyme